jgi:hypothetical protein
VTTEPALPIAHSLAKAEAVAYTVTVFVNKAAAGGSAVMAYEAAPITHSSTSVIVVAYTVAVFICKVAAWHLAALANEAAPITIPPAVTTQIAHAVSVFVHEIVTDAVSVCVHEAGIGAFRPRALRQRQADGCHNQQRDNCAHANTCPKSPILHHVYHLLELICALIIPIQFEEIVKELHGYLESKKQVSTLRGSQPSLGKS